MWWRKYSGGRGRQISVSLRPPSLQSAFQDSQDDRIETLTLRRKKSTHLSTSQPLFFLFLSIAPILEFSPKASCSVKLEAVQDVSSWVQGTSMGKCCGQLTWELQVPQASSPRWWEPLVLNGLLCLYEREGREGKALLLDQWSPWRMPICVPLPAHLPSHSWSVFLHEPSLARWGERKRKETNTDLRRSRSWGKLTLLFPHSQLRGWSGSAQVVKMLEHHQLFQKMGRIQSYCDKCEILGYRTKCI